MKDPILKGTAVVSVVDDDRDVRESMEALIWSMGFDVRLFESAEALLQEGVEHECDCIVSDYQMAGMNGISLARKVAESGLDVPFILMSAYATPELEQQAQAVGVRRFFRKPFDADEFASVLTTLLEARSP